MSLFKTGFSVDASVPVPSTSTTAHPGAGSTAHKKRKRSSSNSKVEENVPLQVNGNAPAIRSQQEQEVASPAARSSFAKAKQQSNGNNGKATIQQQQQPSISDMIIASENKLKQQQHENQETVVNIEKLMKKLQRMEKGEKAEKNASSRGNGDDALNKKKQKLSGGASAGTSTRDSAKNKGKGKDIGGSASAATAEGGETTSSTTNNNNKKNKNKKTKAGKSDAPKVDYVPDEAALAKREERKRKKEAQKISSSTTAPAAAITSAGTVVEKGGGNELVVESGKEADESNMHIDLLEVESLPVVKTDAQESKPSKKKKKIKKGKKDDDEESTEQGDMKVDADVPTSNVEDSTPKTKKQKKTKMAEKTDKNEIGSSPVTGTVQNVKESKTKSKQQQPAAAALETSVQSKPSATTSNVQASDSGMTELQKKMQKKLGGARFRWINEQLYTTSGVDALQLMEEDPAMFEDYHNGFASQAASWPSQPIQLFIDFFRSSSSSSANSSSASPKPVIADLGCGKAELAATLVPLGYTVLSYDLVESEPYIIKAQCTKRLPLPGSSSSSNMEEKDDSTGAVVDYVVCCLSLMGSDWLGMIREARRVLKSGGKLKIAEVTSRFEDVKAFIDLITAMGFKLLKKDESNTHFILFDFEKVPMSSCKSPLLNLSSEAKIEKSQELLKPCIYKRR